MLNRRNKRNNHLRRPGTWGLGLPAVLVVALILGRPLVAVLLSLLYPIQIARIARHEPSEPLEARQLLTTYLIDSPSDNTAVDGQVTLREAILAANTNSAVGDALPGTPGLDTINFAGGLTGPMPGPHLQKAAGEQEQGEHAYGIEIDFLVTEDRGPGTGRKGRADRQLCGDDRPRCCRRVRGSGSVGREGQSGYLATP